ncbi:glycosyltransferase [Clostridium perfringens]|nr:glycosyltransferase [Clostridium perfringens]
MKVTFIHDHKIKVINDIKYSNGGLGANVLEKYVKLLGEVMVICRGEYISNEKNVAKLVKAESKNVDFLLLDNFINIKENKKIISEQLKNTEFLIVRLPSILGQISIKYAEQYKIPYVIELVGCPFDAFWNHGSFIGKFLAPIMYWDVKRKIASSKNVIYVTSEFLQKRYPTNGKKLACSDVIINDLNTDIINKRINKIKNKKSEMITIGLIGNFSSKYKGLETAIKSLAILKENNLNVKLEVLGLGNKEKYEKIASKLGVEENVFFNGIYQDKDTVFKWLDYIDIYIQPSYVEGMPRATIEAMSRGCPVAASNVGGLKELINPTLTHKPRDYKKLANDLLNIIYDKKIMIENSKINFEKSKSFSENILFEKKKSFFEDILS